MVRSEFFLSFSSSPGEVLLGPETVIEDTALDGVDFVTTGESGSKPTKQVQSYSVFLGRENSHILLFEGLTSCNSEFALVLGH